MASISAESQKMVAEYVKHVSMLSTGSLVLLVTFLEKLKDQPDWKFMVGVSIIGFLLSLFGGLLTYTFSMLVIIPVDDSNPNSEYSCMKTWALLFYGSIALMWIGFLVGVTSLSFFALKNL